MDDNGDFMEYFAAPVDVDSPFPVVRGRGVADGVPVPWLRPCSPGTATWLVVQHVVEACPVERRAHHTRLPEAHRCQQAVHLHLHPTMVLLSVSTRQNGGSYNMVHRIV